ncbi:MAG: hypothetical protein IKJ45_15915 [Kiritimatiellae bacterium]|nr:hypothetical protein [Kiritimatiellia bacterium]
MNTVKSYDLILSLGGSCAVANQLKVRGLRPFSLPLDWIFCVSPDTLARLADCFRDDFARWMLPENLVEVDSCDWNAHAAKYQYRDTFTGYRFLHDFVTPKEVSAETVRVKYRRRIDRLYDKLQKADSLALCFDAKYPGSEENVLAIRSLILEKFGAGKNIDCYLVEFCADRYETIANDHLEVFRFTHPRTDYIFGPHPTFEFGFMDNFRLTGKFKSEERGKGRWYYLAHTPHGIQIWLWRTLRPIFGMKLSLGSKTFDFRIGQ